MTSPEYGWSSQSLSEGSSSESEVSESNAEKPVIRATVHKASRELYSSSSNGSGFKSENNIDNTDEDFEDEVFCCSSSPYSDTLENLSSSPRLESSPSCSDSDNTSFWQVRLTKRPRVELGESSTTVEPQPATQCILDGPYEEGQDENQTESVYEGDLLQSQSDDPGDQSNEHISDASPSSNPTENSSSSNQSNSESEASTDGVEDSASMPAFLGSQATRSNFEATLLALSKKHKFSKSTRNDLLKFLNIISPSPNLPSSSYSFDQDIWKAIDINYDKYEFCPGCHNLLCFKTRICDNDNCEYFNVLPTKEPTELFFIIPIIASLTRILEENWTSIENYKSNHTHDEGKYRDICCGELYRQQNGCDDPTMLLSLLFHIDGAPAVKSKTLSLWPIQCILVELPASIRYSFKNVLFCGLWCGVKKPDLQLFQKYFVDQVQAINESGLNVKVRKTKKHVKVKVLNVHGHIADLVAKAPSLNFRQFNGHFGCSICLHPGERIAKGKGTVQIYPVYEDIPERRNHSDTMDQAQLAQATKKSLFGVLGTSPLHDVLRIPDSLILDYMHLVLEGEFVRRLSIWLNGQDENGFLAKQVAPLEDAMDKINFPHDFNRKLRPFRDFKRWKDREIQNFFLHASLPLLKTFLPPQFFYHLSIFVTAIWLLIDDQITSEDIELARILLVHYGRLIESLYGKSEQTYTVHALQHLPEQVKNFGPLILHSGFVFEAMISHLKRLFHGTRCIPDQIVKNLIIAQNTNTFIENSTSSGGNEELFNFARNLADHKKSSSLQEYDGGISLIGEVKKCVSLHTSVLQALRQLFGTDMIVSSIMEASRMKKDHQVYHSLAYKRKGKSCSYLVQYQSQTLHNLKYGKILSYLVVHGVPLAAIQCFQHGTRSIMSGLQDPEDELVKAFNDRNLLGKPFVSVNESDEIDVTPCTNILRRCIFVPCSEGAVLGYLCPVLKNYEHD